MTLIYHGTNEPNAIRILKEGILPRKDREAKGNWTSCPSRQDMVYLTTIYAPYFAGCSTPDTKARYAILEVDLDLLDEAKLHPDEDFLEQSSRDKNDSRSMAERTQFARDHLEHYREHWEDSLNGLGTVAYQGAVPPEAITRAVLYAPYSNPYITTSVMDPSISLMNHALCGQKYRGLTRWFFEEDVTPYEVDTFLTHMDADDEGYDPYADAVLDMWGKNLAKRDGLEVLK